MIKTKKTLLIFINKDNNRIIITKQYLYFGQIYKTPTKKCTFSPFINVSTKCTILNLRKYFI
jgi:hypothetical protein